MVLLITSELDWYSVKIKKRCEKQIFKKVINRVKNMETELEENDPWIALSTYLEDPDTGSSVGRRIGRIGIQKAIGACINGMQHSLRAFAPKPVEPVANIIFLSYIYTTRIIKGITKGITKQLYPISGGADGDPFSISENIADTLRSDEVDCKNVLKNLLNNPSLYEIL